MFGRDPTQSLIESEDEETITVFKGLFGNIEDESRFIPTVELRNRKKYIILEEFIDKVTYQKVENLNEIKEHLKIKD